MEIVNINTRFKEHVQEQEQKKAMLEVIAFMKDAIEKGEIKEFVASSIDADGVCQIHVAAMDLPGSIGLYEIGKHLLINGESDFD